MKKIFILAVGSVLLSQTAFGQITPNGNSGSTTTAYTSGAANDPIYIWCNEGLASATGSLTATPTNGTAPYTFEWYFHNQATASWNSYFSDAGMTSTINGLASDGYRVEIYDNGGNLVDCDIAWVWNMNTDVTASNASSACDATNLTGTINVTNFSYYNPPPPESLINPSTEITVCFDATHTYVSDLGFFLVAPAACGTPTIPLSPHPEAINAGNGCCCNSGNNVNDLCFSTTTASALYVCGSGVPLTGTFGAYETNPINWAPLYGCNAAQGGWQVQIYDCIGADVGALTHASITFSNLTSVCGSPTTITYDSGAINSAINDNSCSAGTASLFSVPPSPDLTTPITINPTVNYIWTSSQATTIPNPTTSLTNAVVGIPTGTTDFTLDVDVSYAGTLCSYSEVTSFIQTCCTVSADAGSDVAYCTGSSAQIGTPIVLGMDYSWSPATDLNNFADAQPIVSAVNGGAAPITITYTLTVTNNLEGGCTATDDVIVTVNPLPVVDAGTYGPLCPEAGLEPLVGSPAGGAFSGTGVSGNDFDPLVGTQTITYDYTDGNGCSNSTTTNIVVNPAAVIDGGSDESVCAGFSVTLSGSGGSSYAWDNGGVDGVPFNPAVGTTTFTVTGTDANGCVDTDQVDVTAYSLPNVSAGADQAECEGTQITLSGSGAQTYSWSNGVTNGVAFTQAVGTTTYTVTGTDANGCVDTDQVDVTINPGPVVNAGTYSSVCPEAANVVLVGSPVGGTFSGTGVVGNNFDPSVGTQTITYNYTDLSGCSGSATTTITVFAPANINAGNDEELCEGNTVTLSGSGGVSYVWDNGVTNNTAFTQSVGTTTYTVTGTDANGCVDTDQVNVTVVAQPIAIITSDVNTGLVPLTVTFYNNSISATAYEYYFGLGTPLITPLNVDQAFTYTSAGTYNVILTATNGICESQDTVQIIVLPLPPPEVIVPNVLTPNNDDNNDVFYLTVQYVESIELAIYNRWGNAMFEGSGVNPTWDGNTKSGQPADEGTYFCTYKVIGINGDVLEGHGFLHLIR